MYHPLKLHKIFLIALTAGWLTASWALDSDKYEVMHVISDNATYDRNQHTITYEGTVQVNQGTSHLDGDKMIVYQLANGNKIRQIITYGNPAHYNTIPSAGKNRLYVEALKITYDPIKKTVLLEGKGRVNQDGNIFSGPYIWYDMINGMVHSRATKGQQRSEMIIQPQQQQQNK